MTDFLVKKFVKNSEDTGNTEVRRAYSTLSSVTGLICNIALFLLKYAMGILSGSISITSDAFNNLSDCGGCIVSFLGCKMASRPADKDHPFGHGRVEYLTSLILSVIILVVGFELFKGSVEKIYNPVDVEFSVVVLVSLILSIGVKLWMSVFNMKLGRKINSGVLTAAANDSRNDVIATSAAIIALVSSLFTDFPVDGIMGLVVSAFIIRMGIEIVRETIDELIGKPVSSEISDSIRKMILSDEDIIDVHDLVIHSYGITNMTGSCHIGLRSDKSFKEVHDIADRMERAIQKKFNISLTLHTDPVDVDDTQTMEYRELVTAIAESLNEGFSIHDFRLSGCGENRTLIFDMIIPFRCSLTHEVIKSRIDAELKEKDCIYDTVITFDYE